MAKLALNTFTTYSEAEEARKKKQKQFPNFYTRIRSIKYKGKAAYKVEVK